MSFHLSADISGRQGGGPAGESASELQSRPSVAAMRPRHRFGIARLSPKAIRLTSPTFFRRELSIDVSLFVQNLFHLEEVQAVSVAWAKGHATVIFSRKASGAISIPDFLAKAGAVLRGQGAPRRAPNDVFILRADLSRTQWARRPGHALKWTIAHSLHGRARFRCSALESNRHLASVVEEELVTLPGVESFSVSALTGSVLVDYSPRVISIGRLLRQLREVTETNRALYAPHRCSYDFSLNSACLPLALAAELAFPPAGPLVGLLVVGANKPTLQMAWKRTFVDRRLGCDFLDSLVLAGCLFTGHYFGMALIGWCLSLGRLLLTKTREDSQKLLRSALSKQPRFAWLLLDDKELEVTVDSLKPGDVIAVHAGDMLPVDGEVVKGDGLVDQHTLTGESAPVEKSAGDPVLAATMLISGEFHVKVLKSGCETTSAKIGAILQHTADYKLSLQTRGESLSDRAVPPTLALGGLGLATLGLDGGVAVLNSECGTGIRMAAPLGVLSSLTLCATKGILVKDGRAIESFHNVDTVLFDKTGTLTREVPEVCEIHCVNGLLPDEILAFAATAEQRFSHPIAVSILDEAARRHLPVPAPDASDFKIGFGVEVFTGGRRVRVGSPRYMTAEGLRIPPSLMGQLDHCGRHGHSMVMLAVDDEVAGGIELRASSRPEAFRAIQSLRKMGVREMAVISGDRTEPTRHLAETLGLDRFFAEVLPQEKAAYVEKLQAEGRKVCFVGDGVNDAIALKKADVSISLRGASAIATDSAQVILLEGNLSRVPELYSISRMLHHNVQRSWQMILVPNLICVAGVFTMGFGVFHSVLTNNVAALAALANGLLPLQRAARLKQEKDLASDLLFLRSKISALADTQKHKPPQP